MLRIKLFVPIPVFLPMYAKNSFYDQISVEDSIELIKCVLNKCNEVYHLILKFAYYYLPSNNVFRYIHVQFMNVKMGEVGSFVVIALLAGCDDTALCIEILSSNIESCI